MHLLGTILSSVCGELLNISGSRMVCVENVTHYSGVFLIIFRQ